MPPAPPLTCARAPTSAAAARTNCLSWANVAICSPPGATICSRSLQRRAFAARCSSILAAMSRLLASSSRSRRPASSTWETSTTRSRATSASSIRSLKRWRAACVREQPLVVARTRLFGINSPRRRGVRRRVRRLGLCIGMIWIQNSKPTCDVNLRREVCVVYSSGDRGFWDTQRRYNRTGEHF
ncbi:hypothetical protein BC567DRAFT_236975 [Phyllosticta citribraziliensis]